MPCLALNSQRHTRKSPTDVVSTWLHRELPRAEDRHRAAPYTAHRLAARVKRVMDLLGSLLLAPLLMPLFAAAMVAVYLSSPGPVLLRQARVGLNGKRFGMWKLRTMHPGAEESERELVHSISGETFFKISDDPRVLPVGHWLRRASVDEIPQLWNVLVGQMSLVGPRPLLLIDFDRFPRNRQMRRFTMPPGLTGLWQVSGRSQRTDQQRMELDLEYVEKWSLKLDLIILWRTIGAVLSGRGAS